MSGWLAAQVLEGATVRLEPLRPDHYASLWEVGRNPELWRWTMDNPAESPQAMRKYLDAASAAFEQGEALPFATRLRATGEVVGCTRFAVVSEPDRSLEIGWTWIAPGWQRTAVNTEVKFLMLRHAFETLGAVRVQLKTDGRNTPSQNAILRIGAKFEGVLRKDRDTWTGHRRDTHMFSILDDEWPDVKIRLETMLARS